MSSGLFSIGHCYGEYMLTWFLYQRYLTKQTPIQDSQHLLTRLSTQGLFLHLTWGDTRRPIISVFTTEHYPDINQCWWWNGTERITDFMNHTGHGYKSYTNQMQHYSPISTSTMNLQFKVQRKSGLQLKHKLVIRLLDIWCINAMTCAKLLSTYLSTIWISAIYFHQAWICLDKSLGIGL